jgi:hypothetical protein
VKKFGGAGENSGVKFKKNNTAVRASCTHNVVPRGRVNAEMVSERAVKARSQQQILF